MALLNGTAGKQPAPSGNADLLGDTDNETMNGEGAQDQDDNEDGDESDATVLCTVMLNKDGSYTIINGDEPEDGEGLAAPEGASPAEGGTPALPEGQTFENEGQALKAILDLMRGATGGTDDGAQSSFEDGFKADSKDKPQQ